MEEEKLKELYKDLYGQNPVVTRLKGGGSSRAYFRLKNGAVTAIGVFEEDIRENNIFLRLNSMLRKNGIAVPKILSVSTDSKAYLLEDLGDTALFDLLKGENKVSLAKRALKELIQIQCIDEKEWSDLVGYAPFSERLVRWDLNYFKYDFLKPAGIAFDEEKLEDDFDLIVKRLTKEKMETGFMYRDFQSRNIMMKDEAFRFIDFQGARKGPMVYDAVSMIWQAKAPFTYEEREELSGYYIDLLSQEKSVNRDELSKQFHLMEILRGLQVLGAYGFRGLIEKKSHFLESINKGVENLNYFKQRGQLHDYPELEKTIEKISQKFLERSENGDKLTVTIFSFSYKRGYPEDLSGNGGGFMFDCRAIHNPGRYDEYKKLTGKDKEVIKFLEDTGEADIFIKNAYNIVSPSIERYIKRKFTSLQVGFGCTGGQHRSVYCAEKFGRMIKENFPQINVRIIHKEQGNI